MVMHLYRSVERSITWREPLRVAKIPSFVCRLTIVLAMRIGRVNTLALPAYAIGVNIALSALAASVIGYVSGYAFDIL